MGKYKININYPEDRMKKNKKRIEDNSNFKPTDRTPVLFGTFERYYLKARGVGYDEFYSDSKSMLHNMILNQVWAIENIPDDRCTGSVITIPGPWFENILDAEAFGAEVKFYDDQPVRLVRKPLKPEDIEKLRTPSPTDGLWGKKIKYFFEWQELLKDYEVRFNGEPGKIEIGNLGSGGDGPILTAMDLTKEDFLLWAIDSPEICHLLLKKITRATIDRGLYLRKIDPRPGSIFLLADDFAELMSAEMYRELCVPYDNEIFGILGAGIKDGRAMHNCGNSAHLIDTFIKDLKITSFWLFGHPVEPEFVAEKMGGKMKVWGNLNCTTLLIGKKEQIYKESKKCLEAFGGYTGFTLGDGANVAPDTPLENLETVRKAAEDFGHIPK